MTKKERAKQRRQRRNRRIVLIAAAVVLVAVFAIGGTVAWLTADTKPVTNTFTAGDINIDLDESDDLDLKMVPGCDITKDPIVTVEAGSEACWLFVKVEESANLGEFIDYTVDTGKWTALTDVSGVYYREVSASEDDQEFPVLTGNTVTVKTTVTKDMMDVIKDDPTKAPTLTFTAYACQKDNVETAADAWDKIKPAPAN